MVYCIEKTMYTEGRGGVGIAYQGSKGESPSHTALAQECELPPSVHDMEYQLVARKSDVGLVCCTKFSNSLK